MIIMKPLWKNSIFLLVTAYLINFVWETTHSVLYSGIASVSYNRYMPILHRASITDAFLVLGMFLLTAIIYKEFKLKKWEIKHYSLFVILGLIAAIWIEYRAVFLLGKWSYAATMPTIFGIGLTPLIQLALTGLIGLWITKKFA